MIRKIDSDRLLICLPILFLFPKKKMRKTKSNHYSNEEAQRRRDIDEKYKGKYGKQELKSKQNQIKN